MNSENSKLRQQPRVEHEQHTSEQHTHAQAQEFNSVEDLLRHDSSQNPAPPDLADRVNNSIAAEPKPSRPWYKALFRS